MNKKLIIAALTLSLLSPLTAHAALKNTSEQLPAVAILDTAIDTTLPSLQGKIIQEVCYIEWTTCPNGKSFMEGPGAASMPSKLIQLNGFDHGTQMASAFVATNPNANIVFIKIIGNTSVGTRQTAGQASVYNALNWVKQNASKYNIQAVTMSQGHHSLGAAGTDYCPKTPIVEQYIKDLSAMNIPTFFPSGNGRDFLRIDWPGCIDASVSVAHVDRQGYIATDANNDVTKLDFFALGYMTVPSAGNIMKNIAGSSSATQVAAANYLDVKSSKPMLSSQEVIDLMKSTSKSTTGRQGTFVKLIDVIGAKK